MTAGNVSLIEMRLAEEQIDRVPGTVGISMGVKLSGVVFFLS